MITKGKTRGTRLDRPPDFTTLRRPLLRWLDAGVGFCLGGVLAGAELFGLYAPFGVAAVAAAGSGITGFAATLGACLGYLCLEGMTDGMRYAASAILTYSVAFAFYDTRVYRLPWFMPAVAMTLSAMTGIVCRGGQGWYGQDLVYFVTEILLTGAAAACYGVIFARWPQHPSDFRLLTPRQWAGVLMLGATVLMALGRVELLRTFSLGRLLAAVAVMTAARQGVSAGGLTGACAGVALDLASGGTPGCSLLYPLAGVVCGLCHQKKKLPAALAYCAAAFLAILWIREDRSGFGMAMETVMGAVLFLLLPLSPWDLAQDKAALAAGRENPGPAVPGGAGRAAAGAFHALREVMETALRPDLPLPPENPTRCAPGASSGRPAGRRTTRAPRPSSPRPPAPPWPGAVPWPRTLPATSPPGASTSPPFWGRSTASSPPFSAGGRPCGRPGRPGAPSFSNTPGWTLSWTGPPGLPPPGSPTAPGRRP